MSLIFQRAPRWLELGCSSLYWYLTARFGSAPASNSREKIGQSAAKAAIMSGVMSLDRTLTRCFRSSLPGSKWFKMMSTCLRFVLRTAAANGVSRFSARKVKLDPCLIWQRKHLESFQTLFEWQLLNAQDHQYYYFDAKDSAPKSQPICLYKVIK